MLNIWDGISKLDAIEENTSELKDTTVESMKNETEKSLKKWTPSVSYGTTLNNLIYR